MADTFGESIATKRPIGHRALIVSKRQRGNPVLEHIRQVPYEWGDIKADYVTGATSCVLFLSMRYHRLHPEYIYTRLGKLGKDFELRVLLVLVDIENPMDPIKELTKLALTYDLAILLAWSSEDAAEYLTELKKRERSTAALLQGSAKVAYVDQITDVLTKVRGVNKTDAFNLLTTYGSFRNILRSAGSLESLEGWGAAKAARLQQAISEPFSVDNAYAQRRGPDN